MSNVATTSSANAVAALQGLRQGLSNVRGSIPAASGEPILKFKKGDWTYGADETEVLEDQQWAVNPATIRHGYVCWKQRPDGSAENAERIEEVMVPMTETKPQFTSLPPLQAKDGTPGEWSEEVRIQMRGFGGEDDGEQVDFRTSSVGGMDFCARLIDAVLKQLATGAEHVVPVIVLKTDSYMHKKWGKTFTPDFDIVNWVTMDGEAPAEQKQVTSSPSSEAEPEQAAAPAEAAATETPVQAEAPAGQSGRRRRRG